MSLNEAIGSAMGKAAEGAVLGHAIGKLRDEADEASIRAMEAEARNEELEALLRKQGIDIPRAPTIQRDPKGQIHLTFRQFKYLLITAIVLVIGVMGTAFIYDYIQTVKKNTRIQKVAAVMREWGAGYWEAEATCQQYGKVSLLISLGLDAKFDESGKLESPRPTGIGYTIYFNPGTVSKIRPVTASGPLAEDGRFSIQEFGERPNTGIYDFRTKRHELKIPGCPLIKPTIRHPLSPPA